MTGADEKEKIRTYELLIDGEISQEEARDRLGDDVINSIQASQEAFEQALQRDTSEVHSKDTRTEEEVREDTIEDLLDANDTDDLQRMQCEMRDQLDATGDEREADLLKYRLDIIKDAIDREKRN